MIDNETINRINFLARKSRSEGLSEEEKAEQARLRSEYVKAFRESLTSQLENTVIVRPDGTREKLNKKDGVK